jgi:Tfp pilus assembly protein PilF
LNAWHNLALVRIAGGDFARAEECLRRAHALQPANAQVLGDLARVLADQGKQGEAIVLYEMMRAGGQANPGASRKLAGLYFEEKYYAKALVLLDELLKGADVQAGDYFLKARIQLTASRELEAGLASLDQALEKKYSDVKGLADLVAELPADYKETVQKALEKRKPQAAPAGR